MTETWQHGGVFDGFAEAYDARRSGYPAEIVDAVVELAGLRAGSSVLEVGCGTGKLTVELATRGLRIDAVDPGENLVAVARRRLARSERVRFHVGRFEDVELPPASFELVVSASAFHWVDPNLGWARAAELLRPGATIAVIQPIAIRTDDDDPALVELDEAFEQHAPELAAERPVRRTEAAIRKGFDEHRGNVSEAWGFLAHPDLTTPAAATLFGPARLTAVCRVIERGTDEAWALFETTSIYHRLGPAAREDLRVAHDRIVDAAGGSLRFTQLVALVTARCA